MADRGPTRARRLPVFKPDPWWLQLARGALSAWREALVGIADPDLETFDLCEAEAQRVRDALLDA